MKQKKLESHPELAAWLPELSVEELTQLRQGLQRDGCIAPILTWNGFIIDGHQRYALCDELGIPFQTREMEFEDIGQVKLWMVEHQRGRRNWTDEQYAFAIAEAMKLEPAPRGRPSKNDAEKPCENAPEIEEKKVTAVTFNDLSESTGVDKASLKRAVKVKKKGSAKVKRAVRAGDLPLRKAAKLADRPKAEQDAAISGKGETETAHDEVLKDETGEPVSAPLVQVFAHRSNFDDAMNHLTQISRAINPLMGDARENVKGEPGGEHIDRQRFRKAMAELRSVIGFARPYAVCPKHSDKGRCLICGGIGWVTKHSYETSGVEK